MMYLPTDEALRTFVSNSNLIEGVRAGVSDPWYFGQHEQAALLVRANAKTVTCTLLHEILMSNIIDYGYIAGVFRTEVAYIGFRSLPRPEVVPQLMNEWDIRVSQVLQNCQTGLMSVATITAELNELHDFALSVHPYADGNGRTFRLMLNYWRQQCGLPWLLFSGDDWTVYVARLRKYEIDYFRPRYISAYKPDI